MQEEKYRKSSYDLTTRTYASPGCIESPESFLVVFATTGRGASLVFGSTSNLVYCPNVESIIWLLSY